mmetsp:Transcript_49612/g.98489  ORF Transcript_49612/g.98489 Transcript_49612/m.98489 type:complete len:109 (+) Transcript_49612:416-742(+)
MYCIRADRRRRCSRFFFKSVAQRLQELNRQTQQAEEQWASEENIDQSLIDKLHLWGQRRQQRRRRPFCPVWGPFVPFRPPLRPFGPHGHHQLSRCPLPERTAKLDQTS